MNKSESKYFNTALLMDQALISLLEVKPFEYITVKEICEKAGVNRSTFYLHYETIADLLNETMERINGRFLNMFSAVPENFAQTIQSVPLNELVLINAKYLEPYLTFIKEHKSVYKAAYKNPTCMQAEKQLAAMSEHIFTPIMTRFCVPERVQAYWIKFYINGCTAIVREWVNHNCEDPIEEIVNIIIACIRPENGQQNRRYGE